MRPNENSLYYIWKYRLFQQKELYTSDGQLVEIVQTGELNTNSGPDFYQAKIKIGETLWAGNVEIHVQASDWFKHHHQLDAAYDNVILHVVWEDNASVQRRDGTLIPSVALKPLVFPGIIDKIDQLMSSQNWIACEHQISQVDSFTIRRWLDRVLIDRLEDKASYFLDLNKTLKGSWEDTFYIGLAKSFGFKVNALPFELLAKMLPQKILARHKQQAFQLEALIFGVSGLLDFPYQDDYPKLLKKEFRFLQAKYNLKTVEPHLWKFSKTRPDNFPTIRLAQFAALIAQSVHLFSKITELNGDVGAIRSLFANLRINDYWQSHYIFDKSQKKKEKKIGNASIDVLLINTIIPLLFCYEKSIGKDGYAQRSMDMLETLKSENNTIIRNLNV